MFNSPETQASLMEFLRPWKLLSFAIGLGLLIVGSRLTALPDWNIPVSIIMAIATYLSSSWVVRVFITRRWNLMPAALLTAWGTIYGCYVGYWNFADPAVGSMLPGLAIAEVAFLYVLCGFVWLYQGSLKEFAANLTAVAR